MIITVVITDILIIILSNKNISLDFLKMLVIPLIPYFIGMNLERDNKESIYKIYILSALILVIYIHMKYFINISSWNSSLVYMYSQKNSASQIIATAILMILSNIKKSKIKVLLIAYFIMIICLMQARTSIISLIFVLIIYILVKSKKKMRFIISLAVIYIIIMKIPYLKNFIFHTFLIDKYNGMSMNSFSSNRITNYINAFNNIKNNLFIGNAYYVDNLLLNITCNSGVIIGLLIIIVIIIRYIKNLFNNNFNIKYKKILFYLTTYYIITSLFEGYPPFGPGVCSMAFWLLSGIYDKENKVIKE